jgi:23S rRNA (uracil1939-C5)-methyltransferase
MSYTEQLGHKLGGINAALKKAGFRQECLQIVPSPKQSHYRNQMDFTIDYRGRVGLREYQSWDHVMDNHMCFLADEQIEQLFPVVRSWVQSCGLSYHDRKSHRGLLRTATLQSSTLGQTMVSILTAPPEDEVEKSALISQLQELGKLLPTSTIAWIVVNDQYDHNRGDSLEIIAGQGFIEEKIGDLTFQISPNAFFQNNSEAAQYLLQTVREFAGKIYDRTVLDLYCGSGFFALDFANPQDHARKVIGVESVDQAIVDAKRNEVLNDRKVEWHNTNTEDIAWSEFQPDVVILDPPRVGLQPQVIAEIMEAAPARIVYVSCNYEKFIEEMTALQTLYRISKMRAIDMFPQTPHVELVTQLTHK